MPFDTPIFETSNFSHLSFALNKIASIKAGFANVSKLLSNLEDSLPILLASEVISFNKNFNNLFIKVEQSFLDQKSILCSTSTINNLRDKLINLLHGIVGSIENMKDYISNLKKLLRNHAHFIPLMAIDNLERELHELNHNLIEFEKFTSKQEKVFASIFEASSNENPLFSPSAFWDSKGRRLSIADMPPGTPPPEKKIKILIVDDSDINRKILGGFLTNKYECHFAQNGHEAVEQQTQEKCDIILMDIIMPKMDGIEATKAIRKYEKDHPNLSPATIIATTANTFNDFAENGLNIGMNDYIGKPFKKEQINEKVQQWVSMKYAQLKVAQ